MGAPNTAFVRQFQDSISMLAQQLDSRLRATCMVDTNFKGEMKMYDQYSTDDMTEIISRYQDTPVGLPNHERRKVVPRYFVSNTIEDPTDALQMIVDPKSAYMQAKRASANRKIDDIVISALGGTAYSGQNGTTSNTLSGTSLIAAGGTGMTKLKLITAKVALDENEADSEDRYLVHTASQLGDLLNTTEIASSDYNVVRALVEGQVDTWLGFKFVRSERLGVDGSSARKCYAYQKKGIQLAIAKEAEGRIDERPDKNYGLQVYLKIALGAVRLEEDRVVEIKCVETF